MSSKVITSAYIRSRLPKMTVANRNAVLAQMQPDAPKVRRGMNKTEAAFAKELEMCRRAGKIVWFEFESMRLHLGGGAWFKVDFPTLFANGKFVLYETKGWWREAARLRMKVAAGKFPHWTFVGVQRDGRGWKYEEFRP